jgi:hypothetical protein
LGSAVLVRQLLVRLSFDETLSYKQPTEGAEILDCGQSVIFVENQSYDPFWAVVNVTITTYFWRFLLKTKVMIHFVIK